ncbi:MAG: hypothetical protein C0469_04820 [Cyanobacteria bacterium DS2.3.42]|nr:hypothetical protein [Cyanobacteria bacterium DS2.3.42]
MYRLLTNEDSEPFLPQDDKGDISKEGIRGALFWLFAVALLIRLWFCFFHSHVNAYAGFDAVGYINAAKAIFELNTLPASFAKDCFATLTGSASTLVATGVHDKLNSLQPVMLSGPSYPLFLVLTNILTISPYDPTDWIKPVAAQCMISAVTVVFIAAIGRQLFDRKTGAMAGAIATIYPPFIINCGRACTETFAVFLLCLFSYIFLYTAQTQLRSNENQSEPIAQFQKIAGAAIVLGIVAALLSLARTTLLPVGAVAVVMLFFRLNGKMRIGAISSFLVGFALVIVPWFAAQQLIVGRASLVVDRVSRLNYGLGTQSVTQGWTGFPIQFKPIMDRTINAQTMTHLSEDPGPYLWLLQDKLPRMLKCGWNDFKTWLGLFSPAAQDVLHQFIIAFAIAGIILGLEGVREKTNQWRGRVTGIIFMLLVLLMHLPYVFFITVGRYNLTAMPFLMVFGAWGLRRLRHLGNWSSERTDVLELAYPSIYLFFVIFVLADPTAILVNAFGERGAAEIGIMTTIGIKSVLFFFLVGMTYALINKTQQGFYSRSLTNLILTGITILSFSSVCLPVRAHGRWYERPNILDKQGEGITFELFAPPAVAKAARAGNAYLMVDAESLDSITNGLSISIDGKTLKGPYLPGLSLLDDQNHFERRGNELTRVAECLFESFSSVVGLANNDVRQWFLIAIPADTGPSLLAGSGASQDTKHSMRITIKRTAPGRTRLFKALARDDRELIVPEWLYYSWDKAFYGVERRGGVCDPRTDRKIDAHKGDDGYYVRLLLPSPAEATIQPFKTLSFLDVHEVNVEPKLSLTNEQYKSIKMGPVPNYSPSDQWLMRVSGRYKTIGKLPPGVEVISKSLDNGQEHYYNAPWAPKILQPSARWRNFDVACPIKPQAFPGHLNQIEVRLHVLSPALKNLTHPVESEELNRSSCQFEDVRIEINALPGNPLGEKHSVY